MNEKLHIALNSAMLYVLAFLSTTILHELSHALFGVLYKTSPILHHNFVAHGNTEHLLSSEISVIALAGPVASLVQGSIAGWIVMRSKKRSRIQLFTLWFSILGFFNFLGYFMTGPLFQSGDIGKAYQLMNIPVFLQILFAIFSAGIMLLIAYKITRPFLEFSYKDLWISTKPSRKNFSFHILILPWLIGSLVVSILYLPIVALISIIYPIMSGMVFIFPWQNSQRIENVTLSNSNKLGQFSFLVLIPFLTLIVLFKLILAPGIQF